MPVVDAQPLADALAAAMTAEGIAYAEGRKPTVAAGRPYVVGWFDQGVIGDQTMRFRDGWSMVVVLQSYGLSPDSVRVAVRKARAAVLGLAGDAVAGRVVQMPTHQASPPMQRDDDVDPPLWWQADEWRIRLA